MASFTKARPVVFGEFTASPPTLSGFDQVSMGNEILAMLGQPPAPATPSDTGSQPVRAKSAKSVEVDWNVIIKKGFIEVVIPEGRHAMRRSLSDGALATLEKPEISWKSNKLQDMSDASTNVSLEADDIVQRDNSYSSDGEADVDPAMAYQYMDQMESWWMPIDANGCLYDPASMEAMGFDPSYFWPMQWTEDDMPAYASDDVGAAGTDGREWKTTVMIRNMPNNYTREMLLDLVDSMGFAGKYDFAYLPVDFQSQAGLGYAFIDFCTVADAELCFEVFEGFSNWKVPSEKVCTITWSSPTQGLEQHIERYKNSPVMHHSLPDEWKPVLFQQGVRVAFPPPSKPLKTPKVRQHPSSSPASNKINGIQIQ